MEEAVVVEVSAVVVVVTATVEVVPDCELAVVVVEDAWDGVLACEQAVARHATPMSAKASRLVPLMSHPPDRK
jgi:hypothetical protein